MLELTGLSASVGGFDFGPVDLSVDEEVLAVLGPSGSGKSTLLSLVAGILGPDAGSVTLDGRRLVGLSLEERRTGLVFQGGALFPHMTARENVAYAATDDGRVVELAEMLEIADVLDRRPRALSGGERQRVALARTLAADPDALLLDEPLSSLDAPIRRRLRDELFDLFGSLAIPVVYVTHDQRTATALGDRLAILRDGDLEQVGTPEQVLTAPATPFVARFTGTENVFDAEIRGRDEGSTSLAVGDVALRTTDGTDGVARATDDTDASDRTSDGDDGRLGTTTDAGCGSGVTVCFHPSRVRLHEPDGVGERETASGVDGGARLSGTVRRWMNEGDRYRVVVDVDGLPTLVTATVPPASFDPLPVESGASIHVSVPPDAVRLVG